MKIITIENDIEVLCQTAPDFPDGIKDSFNKLFNLIDRHNKRAFYGIS